MKSAIERAHQLAYEEDADMVVGQIAGEWVICNWEDVGRQAEMESPKYRVDSVSTQEIA